MLCLTAWPGMTLMVLVVATQERRGRLPIHTFLDYVIFNYLIAIIFALTVRARPTLCCPTLLATGRGGGQSLHENAEDQCHHGCAHGLVGQRCVRSHADGADAHLQLGQIGHSTPETPNFTTQLSQVSTSVLLST